VDRKVIVPHKVIVSRKVIVTHKVIVSRKVIVTHKVIVSRKAIVTHKVISVIVIRKTYTLDLFFRTLDTLDQYEYLHVSVVFRSIYPSYFLKTL
jgi:aromatic ring-opening dioxygenase LigB subunit